jgi:prolyl-tRNA synthetase
MRFSRLFGRTTMNAPHDADSINAKLLTQGGFIDKLSAGIYNFLPLGLRVLQKINTIIREEMNAVGGQEILMPALHPTEIWDKTGRNQTMDEILFRTKGAGDKEFIFGPSHEETVTPLAAKFIKSYKDLPLCVYQIQTKFRNEPRAKSGILRGREFGMKDMYSFHRNEEDLDKYYEEVLKAYLKVYERCGLKAYVVKASGGAFTDKFSHEFSIITPAGEDTILVCDQCEEAQNLEIAEGKIIDTDLPEEEELEMKEVMVERDFTVEANAKAHNVEESKILKTVVYETNGGFIGVLIRGDLQINETKLAKFLKSTVRAASPEQLKQLGLVQGFISPVGLPKVEGGIKHASSLPFIADHSIRNVKNFVTGANKLNTDLINVNLGRDFVVQDFTDLVLVGKGFKCATCNSPLREEKAIEAGNIFKLGTKFSTDFNVQYTDETGKQNTVVMGCYGIGNTRLLGTVVEASNDAKGIIWPLEVAPFHIHLLTLGSDDKVKEMGEKIYSDLLKAKFEVLFDERDESAGKKLNDADLIGLPIRIVVSNRTLEQKSVEWKLRAESESRLVLMDNLLDEAKNIINK